MDPVQLVTPAGELCEHPDVEGRIEPELCRAMFRAMVLARRFDTEAFALQRQGELGLWLQCHGQEAAQVGSTTALRSTDYVFPSYREHAAALVRGITPAQLLVQWRGNAHSGWDPEAYRFHVYTLVLAAQLLHATGYARGVQLDGAEEVVLAYFGDGASSEGDTSEAFNFAAVADAPVVFFCQNNQWAISTPTSAQSRTPLHERARGFGLRTMVVDGNDVLAVHAVTTQLAEHARSGSGPARCAHTRRGGAAAGRDGRAAVPRLQRGRHLPGRALRRPRHARGGRPPHVRHGHAAGRRPEVQHQPRLDPQRGTAVGRAHHEVLSSLGCSTDQIAEMQDKGVI